MAALWNRAGHYIFCPVVSFFLSFFFLFSSPNLSGRRLDVYHTATQCGLSANLECRSETCCTRLAENTGRKNSPSGHHRATLSGYIFATKAHIDNRKNIVKQQCIPHMSLQYGELWPTSRWDLLATLGHSSKFQRVSRLGSVTARNSGSGRQPNVAALNRGRHLYSAGRPSRWALAQILVSIVLTSGLNSISMSKTTNNSVGWARVSRALYTSIFYI